MTMTIKPTARSTRRASDRVRRTAAATVAALGTALLLACSPSSAHGGIGSLDILTRGDVQPVYNNDGRRWVVGTPGREYGIRVCNTSGARVLAVTSVDGV